MAPTRTASWQVPARPAVTDESGRSCLTAAARLANRIRNLGYHVESELPHEAPNPVSKKAPRIHIAARRHGGGVAAGGARAAVGDAGDRLSQRLAGSPSSS